MSAKARYRRIKGYCYCKYCFTGDKWNKRQRSKRVRQSKKAAINEGSENG